MDAWLKTHAFFVTAISGAIYMAVGDCHRLSEDKMTTALMAKGVREGYSTLRALGLSFSGANDKGAVITGGSEIDRSSRNENCGALK
jgi:hypothetical protein